MTPIEDMQQFFQSHWRRSPLRVEGGAAAMLSRPWDESEFARARVLAEARADVSIQEVPGEVTFIERVSAVDERLAERAAELGRAFGSCGAWFDCSKTHQVSGIGSHFDHSDNFVLQQAGVKEWRLADPKTLTREQLVRRMVGGGSGAQELPGEGWLSFTLQPGDMLYIPLFWIHSGVSRGVSLSLSLVCPAISLQALALQALSRVLRSTGAGYQPAPALSEHMSDEQRAACEEAASDSLRALLRHASSEDFLAKVDTERKRIARPDAGQSRQA